MRRYKRHQINNLKRVVVDNLLIKRLIRKPRFIRGEHRRYKIQNQHKRKLFDVTTSYGYNGRTTVRTNKRVILHKIFTIY